MQSATLNALMLVISQLRSVCEDGHVLLGALLAEHQPYLDFGVKKPHFYRDVLLQVFVDESKLPWFAEWRGAEQTAKDLKVAKE